MRGRCACATGYPWLSWRTPPVSPPQLISKIELEPQRQTPGHEKRLKRAFAALIDRRRARLDALEAELAGCGGLFQPTEGDEYGI